MYSGRTAKVLRENKIKTGDRVLVESRGRKYEGILMPGTRGRDPSNVIVKLDNGYNVGVKLEKITKLKSGEKIVFKPSDIKSEKSKKPHVSILGCGGTIASRVEYRTGAVFPAFSPGDMLLSFPELKDIARISGRKVFDLLSEDMSPSHWKIIAKQTAKEINGRAEGVVLMHGTDTMHYTSAALSFMLQELPVPVVLVGAQRSSDRGSSDNAVNLVSSVLAAAQSDIAEVSVCMHAGMSDDYCHLNPGTRVRKMHTSRRDAFRSIDSKPFACVDFNGKKIEYLRDDYRKRGRGRVVPDTKINDNVALLYAYPGIKPSVIKSVGRDHDGLVIAGTGLGHVPTNPFGDRHAKSILPEIESLIKSGVPVAVAPQTIYGRLNMNVYTAGRMLKESGVIGDGCDWTPECALVKMMFVLGHTKTMEKIKKMMLTNYAGEISERSLPQTFLS